MKGLRCMISKRSDIGMNKKLFHHLTKLVKISIENSKKLLNRTKKLQICCTTEFNNYF
jgi:hypothetical protein